MHHATPRRLTPSRPAQTPTPRTPSRPRTRAHALSPHPAPQLVVLLNPRLESRLGVSADDAAFFADGGDEGFTTAFAFLTQPLGQGSSSKATTAGGDPVVLWRAHPDGWVFARKPSFGPPAPLLTSDGSRPSVEELEQALEGADAEGGGVPGLLGGLFGGG